MGQLVLLVVAAVWAAVLVPPLLRSRIENRPNSSVSDFRDQLSSLQRTMPSRGVAMRSMARPLAPSPLSRPAAAGRPNLNANGRTHGGAPARLNGHQPAADRRRRPEPVRSTYDATPRARSHAERVARPVNPRDALKRRRANVLFVLALLAVSTLVLAVATRSQAMIWSALAALTVLFGYVCMLGQLRQRELAPAPTSPAPRSASEPRRPAPEPRRHLADRPAAASRQVATRQIATRRPAARPSAVRRSADRWSHAV